MTELGFEVMTAGNGKEGLDIFRKSSGDISLVILDLTLPDIPGLEVYHAIKKVNPEAKIMLTSGFTHELVDNYNVVFIQKPYTISDLNKKLNELIA